MAVKFGVIGAGSGFAFNRSLPAFIKAEHFELAAIMDFPNLLEKPAEKFNLKPEQCYSDLDKFLADPNVEAVLVATPVHVHCEQTLKAIEKGKHVFCEKPLGRTIAEAEKMVEAAQKAGVKLGVAYHMRFHVLHQKAKELIENGTFGNVNLVRMQNHLNYPEIEGAWRQDPATSGGGGPSVDVGSHHIDLMSYLIGSEVAEVTAVTANQVHKYKVEDIVIITIRFKNGTLGMMDLSWSTPNRFNVFEIYGTEATLYGEKTVGPFKDPYGRLLKGDHVEELKPEYKDTYTLEAEAFARWVEFNEPFLIPGEDGLKMDRILEKVVESIHLRKTVAV